MSSELKNSNSIENETIPSSKGIFNKNIDKQVLSTSDEQLKTESKNSNKISKRKKMIIIIISISFLLIIAGLILIIGHFKFDWFMKKNELVLIQNREVNLVTRYLEKKNATNYYDLERLDKKIQNIMISTDFIVGINKRTKINSIFDLSEADYLYESFLLIINFTEINETNSEFIGGINIFEESKSAEDLIQKNEDFFLNLLKKGNYLNFTNKTNFIENFPICKFYYFKNGTLNDIYFPKGMNEFYKTAISDLIEKITPKLSKSLYQNESNKRRLENGNEENLVLNYEQIFENGELQKTIIYEDKIQNEYDNENNIKKNEINSKIKRTFNSFGDITNLELKGEALFKSFSSEKNNNSKSNNLRRNSETDENSLESNESYYNLGFNEFNMNVTSNMELIYNEIDQKIMDKLNAISKFISFEKFQETNETLINEEGNEIELNNSEEENFSESNEKRNLSTSNKINYSSNYLKNLKIIQTDFLGTKIGLIQYLYINSKTNLRQEYLNLLFGNKEYKLSVTEKYHYPNLKKGNTTKEFLNKNFSLDKKFKPFGFLVKGIIKLVNHAQHGVSFDIIKGEMYTKGYAYFDIGVSGSFGPNFFVISFGAELTGYIVKGSSFIQSNTLINSKSKLAKFQFNKKINACSVDLSFYFKIYLIFWKKTYKTTYNLFKGFSSSSNTYSYN